MYEIIHNPYQGDAPRVLFVCSAGILRSATAAHLFCGPDYRWNTRCVGVWGDALVKVTPELVEWAHVVFCMESEHAYHIKQFLGEEVEETMKKVHVLDIPDTFSYRSPKLENLLVAVMKENAFFGIVC